MLTVFTNKKREGINTFVCAVSLYVAESPKASIKEHELTLPIIPFGIVAYGFVGQPFSKQLYYLSFSAIAITTSLFFSLTAASRMFSLLVFSVTSASPIDKSSFTTEA